jgi:DNA (cytosine-5)-methyltransferase 1
VANSSVPIVDLFSGAGGMSCGFARYGSFHIQAAVDGEFSKPSTKSGQLGCNATFKKNLGVAPISMDISLSSAADIAAECGLQWRFPGVLVACPPCTDFSRAKPGNHSIDGKRNHLTSQLAEILRIVQPKYFVYENAREAYRGTHRHHLETVLEALIRLKYTVWSEVVDFQRIGLPQRRERTVVIAARRDVPQLRSLNDLWEGISLSAPNTVKNALTRLSSFGSVDGVSIDERHPSLTASVKARLKAIPKDGGSWTDIPKHRSELLIPSMLRKIAEGKTQSHADAYGRMFWSEVAPTIKRECAHVGNGRYSHPSLHRLLSVSEMAFLQGFPADYHFCGRSLSNCYRQIGDAVPPLVSYQIAALVHWMDSGIRPTISKITLPRSALSVCDVTRQTSKAAA